MSRHNIGVFNNNWKGGHRFDPVYSAPLSLKRQLEIRIETNEELLLPGVIDEQYITFRAEIKAKIEATKKELAALTAQPIRHCLTYANRLAPGKFCPRCGVQLTVNEKPFNTTDPETPFYMRRLTCPNFFVDGCKYREAFTDEIQNAIDAAQAARDDEPAEF